MEALTRDEIKNNIADSTVIFHRGEEIYENGDLLFSGGDDCSFFEFKYDQDSLSLGRLFGTFSTSGSDLLP